MQMCVLEANRCSIQLRKDGCCLPEAAELAGCCGWGSWGLRQRSSSLDCLTVMANRPKELETVERLTASADSNHLFAFRLHRELLQLNADTGHARDLLGESAAIIFKDLPMLIADLRVLGAQWSEVELLDPANLNTVTHAIQVHFAELDLELQALTARQDQIISDLLALLRRARRS